MLNPDRQDQDNSELMAQSQGQTRQPRQIPDSQMEPQPEAEVEILEAPTYVDTPQGTASRVTVVDGYLPRPMEIWDAIQAGSYAVVLLLALIWLRYGNTVAQAFASLTKLSEKLTEINMEQQKALEDLTDSISELTRRIRDPKE